MASALDADKDYELIRRKYVVDGLYGGDDNLPLEIKRERLSAVLGGESSVASRGVPSGLAICVEVEEREYLHELGMVELSGEVRG